MALNFLFHWISCAAKSVKKKEYVFIEHKEAAHDVNMKVETDRDIPHVIL